MKKCPYCGKENDNQSVNCEKCFAMIPSEKKEDKESEKAQKQGVKKNGS